MLPVQGSRYAGEVDTLYMFLVWMSVFFFVLIAGLIFYSVYAFRRRPGRKSAHITDHLGLELTWSILPLILVMGIFFWGLSGFMKATVAPGDAMEITVTAKKWMWQFEYPDGSRWVRDIHVPVGKPVRFVMMSEDVIHDFFVPAMRVKHDVLPGRYTEVWFLPEVKGEFPIACAEYCGKGHSDMGGVLHVDDEVTYKDWLENGPPEERTMPMELLGARLYETKGCSTCHSLDGKPGQGPTWKGLYRSQQECTDGKSYLADENYLRESILVANAKIVKGYEPIMPLFQGVLRDREVNALIEFIKKQK